METQESARPNLSSADSLCLALDRPIAFHRGFVTITGSVTAALFLSQALYWHNREANKNGRWWWKTGEQWTAETGLSRREIDTARRTLKRLGLIDEMLCGVPPIVHYRVLTSNIAKALQINLCETAKSICAKPPNQLGSIEQINTETSSETSSETTEEGSCAVALPGNAQCVKAEAVAKTESKHHQFISFWETAYKATNGGSYPFNGGRDAKAVKLMVSNGDSPEDLVRLAVWAWRYCALDDRNRFLWQRCQTIHGFHENLAVLRALRAKMEKTGLTGPDKAAMDHEEWRSASPEQRAAKEAAGLGWQNTLANW